MNTRELAYFIWEFYKRTSGERSADECWYKAESIQQGNREEDLFSETGRFYDWFKPFGTFP